METVNEAGKNGERALATVSPSGRFSLSPNSIKEAMDLAAWIAKSDLAPKDYKDKPQNCLIAIQMGLEVGLSPMQAIQNIAVINGRPTIWGDAMLAIVQAHPAYEWHKEAQDQDGKWAEFTIKRRGNEPHTVRFTVEDAKKAGLWGKQGTWTNYPGRMMQMRARAFGLRDKFADALRGLQSAEEVTDYIDTTATREPVRESVQEPKRASETTAQDKQAVHKTLNGFVIEKVDAIEGDSEVYMVTGKSGATVKAVRARKEVANKARMFIGKSITLNYIETPQGDEIA